MVTLKEIARAAGVSHSTVSRALRDHPRINTETRLRIQELARAMGYRPDPALTALAAYRHHSAPAAGYGTIAVLGHHPDGNRLPPYLADQTEGIRERATALGFETEYFAIRRDEQELRHLSRVLFHRGIHAIVVLPLAWEPVGFDWSEFAAVGIGENAWPLNLNYVSFDHDAAIQETYRQLRARGYRNIGFTNLRGSEERNRMLFASAYLKCRHIDGLCSAPPLLTDSPTESPLPWLRKHRFDAVMSHFEIIDHLEGTEFRIPENLGVAGFATSATKAAGSSHATYVVDGRRLGSVAVDLVQTQLQRNRTGIPDPSEHLCALIRGQWRDGDSARPILASQGVRTRVRK